MDAVPLMLLEEDVERGGKEQSQHEIQDDFAYRNNVHNADIKIRMGKCASLGIQYWHMFAIKYSWHS